MQHRPPGPGWWRAADGGFQPPEALPDGWVVDAAGNARPFAALPAPVLDDRASPVLAAHSSGHGFRRRVAAAPGWARSAAALVLVAGAGTAFAMSGSDHAATPPTFVAGVTVTRAPAAPTSSVPPSTTTPADPTTTTPAPGAPGPTVVVAALAPAPTNAPATSTPATSAPATTAAPATVPPPTAAPTTAPATTAVPTTVRPTTTPVPTTTRGSGTCTASVLPPTAGNRPTVLVASTAPNAAVTVVVRYGNRSAQYRATTNGAGTASVSISVAGSSPGDVVSVEVTVGSGIACKATYVVV